MPSIVSYFFRYLIKKRSIANQTTHPDIAIARQALEDAARKASFLPRNIKVQTLKIGEMDAEWLIPPDARPGKVLLYLHGGGYIRGSISTHRALMGRISLAGGVRVLAVGYRRAPENKFPAALEDICQAYNWLIGQGFAPKDIAVGGDSAGGGLTLALMLTLHAEAKPMPALCLLLSPWTDLAGTGESLTSRIGLDPMFPHYDWEFPKMYAGDNELTNPLISPLYADLSHLPPLYILVGDHEIIRDDSTRLAERARAAGVDVTLEVWDYMWHVWMFFAPWLPEANRALKNIGQYLRKRLS